MKNQIKAFFDSRSNEPNLALDLEVVNAFFLKCFNKVSLMII